MGMRVDFSDFDKGMEKLVNNPSPMTLTAGFSGPRMNSCTMPTMSHREAPHDNGNPLAVEGTERSEIRCREGDGVLAGFNIVYAARWHELTPEEDARINWTLPGSGRKYP